MLSTIRRCALLGYQKILGGVRFGGSFTVSHYIFLTYANKTHRFHLLRDLFQIDNIDSTTSAALLTVAADAALVTYYNEIKRKKQNARTKSRQRINNLSTRTETKKKVKRPWINISNISNIILRNQSQSEIRTSPSSARPCGSAMIIINGVRIKILIFSHTSRNFFIRNNKNMLWYKRI